MSAKFRESESIAASFAVNRDSSNVLLAESCLCYHLYASEEPSVMEMNFKYLFPFWDYSAEFWPKHMEMISKDAWGTTLEVRAKKLLTVGTEAFLKLHQICLSGESPGDWEIEDAKIVHPSLYLSCFGYSQLVSMALDDLRSHQDIHDSEKAEANKCLRIASIYGHYELVRMLLDRGADINDRGAPYSDALQAAAYGSHIEIINLLLDRGAEVNLRGGSLDTAIQAAAVTDSSETLEFLLNRGADINAQGGMYGTALIAACRVATPDSVMVLLNRGANVNIRGADDGSALQAAVTNSNLDRHVIQSILDHGADVNAEGGLYGDALSAAVIADNFEVIGPLINHGAKLFPPGEKLINLLQNIESDWRSETVGRLSRDLLHKFCDFHSNNPHLWAAS